MVDMQYDSLGRTWQSARQGKIYYLSRMHGSTEQSRVLPGPRPELLPIRDHCSCSINSNSNTGVIIAGHASSWVVRHNPMSQLYYSHKTSDPSQSPNAKDVGGDQSSGLKDIRRLRQLLIAINGSMNQHANSLRMPADDANLKPMPSARQPGALSTSRAYSVSLCEPHGKCHCFPRSFAKLGNVGANSRVDDI